MREGVAPAQLIAALEDPQERTVRVGAAEVLDVDVADAAVGAAHGEPPDGRAALPVEGDLRRTRLISAP